MNELKTPSTIDPAVFGEALRREFDLVVAANVMENMRTGKTVYNAELNARIASHCMHLDPGLKPEFLGVLKVPPHEPIYDRVESFLKSVLVGKPRGAWAILDLDGKFDCFVSNGLGGIGTQGGHLFVWNSASAPSINNFEALYGTIFRTASYLRREEIEAEIRNHSVQVANPAPGMVAKDVYLNSKRFSKVLLTEVNRNDADEIESAIVVCSRRGVAKQMYKLPVTSIANVFSIPMVMPRAYEDPRNPERLRSMRELRQDAAQKAWDELPRTHRPVGATCYQAQGLFRQDGDVLTHKLWGDPMTHKESIGEVKVTFEPGTATVTGIEAYEHPEPEQDTVPGMGR